MPDPATEASPSRHSIEKADPVDEQPRPASIKKSRPSTASTRVDPNEEEATGVVSPVAEDDVEKGSTRGAEKGATEVGKDDDDPFLVRWDGPDDPENPQNWPMKRKWALVLPLSLITLVSPLASSMFAPGIPAVLQAFHSTSSMTGSFVVSVYILGYAFGPLLIAPLSEIYGRAICYHVSNITSTIFTILCAESQSLGMLIAMRLLAGISGSTPITIGGGTLADVFRPQERGGAMAIWSMGPLLGPIIGPVAGGFLAQAKGWRYIFYVITAAQGAATVYCWFSIKESYHPVLLQRKALKIRKETGEERYTTKEEREPRKKQVFVRSIVRPLKMLFLNPIVAAMSVHMATTYSYLYLLFTTFPSVFEATYGFSAGTVGLTYLGLGVGCVVALGMFGKFSDRIVARRVAQYGKERPEDRLPYMVPGQFTIPIGLFWYGWSAHAHTHWIVPIIGTGFVGIGMISTFFPINAYLLDAFGQFSASAIAAVTVLRSLCGALVPLAGPAMYKRLGLGWGNSTLAFIALALSWVPVWLLYYGERLRHKYGQRF